MTLETFYSLNRCFNGRMTQRLECVPPDALLIVGGRSDTYGVLSSVELVIWNNLKFCGDFNASKNDIFYN